MRTRTKVLAASAAVMAMAGVAMILASGEDVVATGRATLSAGDGRRWLRAGSAAPARDFTPGARWSYQLEVGATLAMDAPDGTRKELAVELGGTWDLTVVGADGDRVELRAVLRDPSLSSELRGADGPPPGRAPEQALAAPLYLVAARDGRIVEVLADPELDRSAAQLLQSLALGTQLVMPDAGAGTWTIEEEDALGPCTASYTRGGERVRKTKRRPAPAGGARPEAGGETRYELGRDGWPLVVETDETLRIPATDVMPATEFGGRQRLRLVNTGTDAEAIGALSRARDRLAAVSGGPGSTRSDPRDLARKALGEATFGDLQAALHRVVADGDAGQRAQLAVQLVALFQLDPDAPAEALAAIRAGATEQEAAGLLAALGAAGGPEAQTALRDALGDRSLEPAVRTHAAIALGLTPDPDADTVAALARGTRDGVTAARQVAELALGNAARRAGDREVTDGAIERLLAVAGSAATPQDQVIALEALGNAGDDRILPAVRQALASDSESVRAAAARSLRFVADPAADQLLAATLLGDPAAPVRLAAGEAAGMRALSPLLTSLARALEHDPSTLVRAGLVNRLAARLRDTPEVRPLLERAAADDEAAEVRDSARGALEPG